MGKQQTIDENDFLDGQKFLTRDEFAALFQNMIEEDHIVILSDKQKISTFKQRNESQFLTYDLITSYFDKFNTFFTKEEEQSEGIINLSNITNINF